MYSKPVLVTRVQRFCTHDGPGVRTTVFLKGCPLKCAWCHNPEAQDSRQQILYARKLCIGCRACEKACAHGAHVFCADGAHEFFSERCAGCGLCADACPSGACELAAKPRTVLSILDEAERDRAFYGDLGGITLSGGEPMLMPEACFSLLEGAKARGLGTAIETCGFFDIRHVEKLAALADIVLWDYKDSNAERHKLYTGVDNAPILENLCALNEMRARIRLRCILVEGVNLCTEHLRAICDTYHSLSYCEGVDLLPYHAYGTSKAEQLGRKECARREWIPSSEAVNAAAAFLSGLGVPVSV